MPRRKRLAVEERRAELVRLGRDLFRTYGYYEISVDKFARVAGVSKGLIYHYFPSKYDFFAAVKRANEIELERSETACEGTEAVERLISVLDEYLAHAENHAAALTAVLDPHCDFDPEATRLAFASARAIFARCSAGLCLESQGLRRVLQGVIGYVEGAVLDWLCHRDIGGGELHSLLASSIRQTFALGATRWSARAYRADDAEPGLAPVAVRASA